MKIVLSLVLVLLATFSSASSASSASTAFTKCHSSVDCGERECCVVYAGFSEKEFLRGYCEPLGGLGFYCINNKAQNLTWTTEDHELRLTNVYFKCPCEDSLVCENSSHCGPRTPAVPEA